MSTKPEYELNDADELLDLLLALLDRIEIEEDWTLASQRHELAKACGYEVVFTGLPCSSLSTH